jgi:hypothetical protein
LLTRSFSYSALRTYMHIPTKKLLTPEIVLRTKQHRFPDSLRFYSPAMTDVSKIFYNIVL